jgi:ATP:ADP antiporter, AAA family
VLHISRIHAGLKITQPEPGRPRRTFAKGKPMQPTPATPQADSLPARLLRRVTAIEPAEVAPVIASFLLFFLVMGGYFAVRPVRETIGTILGREETADVWVYTSIAAVLIIPLYGAIVARMRRSVFLPCVYGAVAILLVATGLGMRGDGINPLLGKCFYVAISVVNLLLISMFWSFLLEIFATQQTKRLFGVVAAGGSAGALLGPLLVSEVLLSRIGNSGVLFFGAGVFVAAIVCQRVLIALWSAPTGASAAAEAVDRPIGGNILAGVPLLLRSPYLLGIALFVVGVSTINTLLYFEQLSLVERYFPDLTERTRIFARFDWIVQGLTMVSQIVITGQVAQRFGVTALVMIVPVAMIFGFLVLGAGFVAFPPEGLAAGLTPASFALFWIVAVVVVVRRFGEYAFARPGREMLWSKLDKETKYKAKNTVDVPVYRASDALVAQVDKALGAAGVGPVVVAGIGAVVAAGWAALSWWLGRQHETAHVIALPNKSQDSPAVSAPSRSAP